MSIKQLIDKCSLSAIQFVQTARRTEPVCNYFIVVLSMAQFCITVGDSARIDGWPSLAPVANSTSGTVCVRALYRRRAERERETIWRCLSYFRRFLRSRRSSFAE